MPGRARLGQLMALVGLTGFAVSQPILSVAGENPTLFVFNNVDGLSLVAFALAVAIIPPLVLWALVVVVGLVNRRAGDVIFFVLAMVLAGCTAIQLAKSIGLENRVALALVSAAAAIGFGVAIARYNVVRTWIRYTAILPALAVAMFLVASPTSDLLQSRSEAVRAGDASVPPVVFLMLDELPTQSLLGPDAAIDRVRYPNLAALADQATWYRKYSAMAAWTEVSVPSILSGTEPRADEALWTNYPDTIFSLLAPTHQLTTVESLTELCGFSDCGIETSGDDPASSGARIGNLSSRVAEIWQDRISLGSSGDVDLGEFGEQVTDVDADVDVDIDGPEVEGPGSDWMQLVLSRPNQADAFMDALQAGDQPGFYYLHLLFPHQPWRLGPMGRPYTSAKGNANAASSEWNAAVEEQQHLWQLRYTDGVVGQIMDRLREAGLYDDAVIVVTSDHGVAFEGSAASGRELSDDTIADIAYAPLIVKAPGQTSGNVDDSNLMAIDLLPTLAEAIGVRIPWSVAGHPAGSAEILSRGNEKLFYDFGDDSARQQFEGIIRFDSSSGPSAASRSIGPIAAGSSPVTGLVAHLGLGGDLGRPLDDLGPTPGGHAELFGLAQLQHPPARRVAIVAGTVVDPIAESAVLIALNGVVVSAAPVEDDGTFRTLIPPGLLDSADNQVRLALLDGDQVTELEVS